MQPRICTLLYEEKKDLEGGTRQKKAWQFKRSSETGTGFICLDETTTCCNIHGVDEDDNK
ncbi:unnamed protein product [Arabidopsis thaliana]|uniref:(thale cress) hypothetical protein n=1 Tax=Arabidopsis thaliana TaxID=3702 RepID=A0A178UP91_ARATH|nr:hypothetical protein AXX17_AT5G10640 [Arabidopsis thaliana]CAD5331369.1 unnamed protein product [Arabidopsis thaliana]